MLKSKLFASTSFFIVIICTCLFATPILFENGLSNPSQGKFGSGGEIKEYSLLTSSSGLSLIEPWLLSSDDESLVLHYSFLSQSDVVDSYISMFMDADISNFDNTYFNEKGEIFTGSGGATSSEIDEPGYIYGDIYDHYSVGTFDNLVFNGNSDFTDDISMGLGFNVGNLHSGDRVNLDIVLSESALSTATWGTVLHQWDATEGLSGNNLFIAGRFNIQRNDPVPVDEPSTSSLLFAGLIICFLFIFRKRKLNSIS